MDSRSLFPRNLFAELDRLQREVQEAMDFSPTIRGVGRGSFPAINVGRTPQSIEVYAFAPGLDPASIDVNVEKGVLSIAGERRPPEVPERATVQVHERFSGRFLRVVTLPDDADAGSIEARYRDGVLHVTVARHAQAQPRRVTIN